MGQSGQSGQGFQVSRSGRSHRWVPEDPEDPEDRCYQPDPGDRSIQGDRWNQAGLRAPLGRSRQAHRSYP